MSLSPNSRRFDRCVTSTATPAATRPSSSRMALLTVTPRPAASEVAEISGVAASTSTATAACESRRRPADRGSRREPGAFEIHQQLPPVRRFGGERTQERRQPGGQFKRRLGT